MSEAKNVKLYRYIWQIDNDGSPLVGQFQYGDGQQSGGGEKIEKDAWMQLYYDIAIQRQRGIQVGSVEVVFNEPAPASEEGGGGGAER